MHRDPVYARGWVLALAMCALLATLSPPIGRSAERAKPVQNAEIDDASPAKPGCGCGDDKAATGDYVCCYFPFAWTESYVSWYAEICPNVWVCYDAPPDDPSEPHPWCDGSSGGPPCIQIAKRDRSEAKRTRFLTAPGLKIKGHNGKRRPGEVMTVLDAQFGIGERTNHVRRLKIELKPVGGNPAHIFAEVHEIRATPRGITGNPPPLIFWLGNQVEDLQFAEEIEEGYVTVVDPGNGNKSNVLHLKKEPTEDSEVWCRIVTKDKIKPW